MLSFVLCLALAGLSTETASARNADSSLARYLLDSMGLDAGQVADAQGGHAVVKLLSTQIPRHVAVFGIIAVHATRDAYLAHLGEGQRSSVARRSALGSSVIKPRRPTYWMLPWMRRNIAACNRAA